MTQQRVILFKGGFQYNVVNYFIDELAEGFERLGLESVVIDLTQPEWSRQFQAQLKPDQIKFWLAFNGIGLPELGEVATAFRIPFVNFYVDAAVYHLDRLAFHSEMLKLVFVDKAELQFVKDNLNQIAAFIPHGACTRANDAASRQPKAGIVFAGSIGQPESYRKQWLSLGKSLGAFYDALLELAVAKECFNIKQDVDYLLKLKGYEPDPEQRKTLYFNAIYVHRYLRCYRRLQVLEALQDFKVDLYGSGWEKVSLHPNHRWHGGIDFYPLIERIQQAQILLNVLPEFVYGGHERIFTAMYHGTAVVTNYNTYLKTNFQDGQDLVFYSLRDLAHLPPKITGLLDDPARLARITEQGQVNVQARHTWLHRAGDLLNLVESKHS